LNKNADEETEQCRALRRILRRSAKPEEAFLNEEKKRRRGERRLSAARFCPKGKTSSGVSNANADEESAAYRRRDFARRAKPRQA